MTIMDEANLKAFERLEQQGEIKRMKKAILEGDWPEVDRLCARPFMRNHKSFLYSAYEQQYLEYIEVLLGFCFCHHLTFYNLFLASCA